MHKIKKGRTQENISQHPTLPSSSSSVLKTSQGLLPEVGNTHEHTCAHKETAGGPLGVLELTTQRS